MKPIVLFFIILLNTLSSYAQNCANENAKYEESSNALITNLRLLLYRSLPIYSINLQQEFGDTHHKKILKNIKSATTYNHFLKESESRSLWTPLLGVSHQFGHSITMHKTWFNHLLQPCDKDLKVDYLSGYILGKLGASAQECEETFTAMFKEWSLTERFNNNRRLNALIAGHFRASYNF